MATKVTILGESVVEKPKKRIEFIHCVTSSGTLTEPVEPEDWENIILLQSNYEGGGLDLMYANNDNNSYGFVYLGYFNDGVV